MTEGNSDRVLWEILEVLSSPDIPYGERFITFLKFVRSYRFPTGVYPELQGMIEDCIDKFYGSWELVVTRFPVIIDSKLAKIFSDKTYDPGHLENLIAFLGERDSGIFSRRMRELRILMVGFIQEICKKYPDQDLEREGIKICPFDFYNYVIRDSDLGIISRGYRWLPMNCDINLLQGNNIMWYIGKDERLWKRIK